MLRKVFVIAAALALAGAPALAAGPHPCEPRAHAQGPDIDPDTGDVIQRPGTTADHFKRPFPNAAAAAASNGGAIPPDLSVMAKAREGGPRYIYSVLTGYTKAPAGFDMHNLSPPA